MESVATNNLDNSAANAEQNAPKPIAEFAARPDFPQCTLNQLVDIGGYAGVVVDIVRDSLRVRSAEQSTKSFNWHTLKKLYGPRQEVARMPELSSVSTPSAVSSEPTPTRRAAQPEKKAPERIEPKRNIIAAPDFTAPVKQLVEFLNLPEFPQNTFGQHLEINGYTGVVVEIINGSLKVRSQEEVTRSYNAAVLKKLYGSK